MLSADDFDRKLSQLAIMANGGTSLEPILRGLQSFDFQAQVQEFVAANASAFEAVCPDGSQPLVWTQYHNEYRRLFDQQLDVILKHVQMDHETFHEFCGWLQECQENLDEDYELPDTNGLRAGEFYAFLEVLTSSENYDRFLQVMFAEVARQQSQQSVEIDVPVPEGLSAGDAMAVEYMGTRCRARYGVSVLGSWAATEASAEEGQWRAWALPPPLAACCGCLHRPLLPRRCALRYEFIVPEGCGAGGLPAFRATVAVPGAPDN